MNNQDKSIAYAFIANGVQIYLNEGDYFLISKLICSNCGDSWYMNLTECFLCGTINPFLFRCEDCGSFQSITKSSGKCNNCGSSKLYMMCPNPNCISNKDEEVKKEANELGGCFNKNSGLLIAQQYCLTCGSQYHRYKNYKILVRTIDSPNVVISKLALPENVSEELYLILRLKEDDKIKYHICKVNELTKDFEIKNLMNSFKDVVNYFYPLLNTK